MKIFLGRSLFKIGDIEYNYNKIIEIYDKSLNDGCDLLIFPEMCIVGFPIYNELSDKSFIKKSNNFVEKIIDYTKKKRARILLGCPYSIEENISKDGIIQNAELYNSAILIDDSYINDVHNKTNINKNNLFNEYKYFDKDVILNDISYENDNFDILIGDEINENKNILFIKERDTDFILCLDTELEQNIKAKQQQLSKIAKWTKKNIIYMNNLSYDIKMGHQFLGDVFVLNHIGEIVYSNQNNNEDILKFETHIENGILNIKNINKNINKKCDFIDIIAKNYTDKKIIFETNKYIDFKEKSIIQITFDKNIKDDKIIFIDLNNYIKNIKITNEIKKIILQNIYKNSIII